MPHIPGPWFPHADNPHSRSLYCASMLALSKPWRNIVDLKRVDETFSVAFDSFVAAAPDATKRILSNIQYFHDCSEKARQREEEGSFVPSATFADSNIVDDVGDADGVVDDDDEDDVSHITEDDILRMSDGVFSTREMVYAQVAMNVAEEYGVFVDEPYHNASRKPARNARNVDFSNYERWQDHIHRIETHPPDRQRGQFQCWFHPGIGFFRSWFYHG